MLHPEIHSRLFNELGLGHPKRALPQSYIPRSFVLAARVILKPPVIMLTYRVITTFLPAKHVSTESLNFFFSVTTISDTWLGAWDSSSIFAGMNEYGSKTLS